MNNAPYYTNTIQHPDGQIIFNGLNTENTCKWLAAVLQHKYPNSQIETVRAYGMTTCWCCGKPIIFTDKNIAEKHYQKNDKLTCGEFCESEKRSHYK